MSELEHSEWSGTTYGNGWMHRWLVRILRAVDVRFIYAFARVFVVPVTMLVNGAGRRPVYAFARKRLGMGRLESWRMVFRNHAAFSQVVIDRFAMYAGRGFNIEMRNLDAFSRLEKADSGFIMLSSHTGNYELAGYSLKSRRKRVNALVFGGEKDSVMQNRRKMFDNCNIRMIPVSADMSHLFAMNAALDNNEIISMPADRVFGSGKVFKIPFFGSDALFPQGPFMLAAAKNVPVLFVSVMKTRSDSYRVTVTPMDVPRSGSVRERARTLACQYAGLLQLAVSEFPEQWYNYFNLWTDD